jgi:predicted nucleic acid-binding protein
MVSTPDLDATPIDVAYFDTAYVLRCYVMERGSLAVRAVASRTEQLVTSELARAEFAAAVHRKRRERLLTARAAQVILGQFAEDCGARVWEFIPVSPAVIQRVTEKFAALPAAVPLRSADAIHLASAAELRLAVIYSNDRHLLAAATHFGLEGIDVIAGDELL